MCVHVCIYVSVGGCGLERMRSRASVHMYTCVLSVYVYVGGGEGGMCVFTRARACVFMLV